MKILIKVKPGAKIEKVEKIPEQLLGEKAKSRSEQSSATGEADFKVWVKEPAKEGKANEAVIRVLAKYFNVPKLAVSIVSGISSKQKIVEILN